MEYASKFATKLIDHDFTPKPTEEKVTQLVCKACGAPLERDGHCAYCGSRYHIEGGSRPLLVEVEHPQVRRVVAKCRVSDDLIHAGTVADSERLGEMTRDRIVQELARSLTSAIKFTSEHDPIERCVLVRGELRVVEPDFRF